MSFIKDIFNFNSKLLKKRGSIVTIGVFDGVHRGHQEIIKRVAAEGNFKGLISLVITFYPHPLQVISKNSPLLIYNLEKRIKLIKKLGIKKVLVINFNPVIATLSPEDFVSQILIDKLNMKKIWVGTDHTFGIKKGGDFSLLKEISQKYSFEVESISPLKIDKEVVCSSVIRKSISEGEIKKANKLLNHIYRITGKVAAGSKRGAKMGYPTANLLLEKEFVIPSQGEYATFVKYKNKYYQSFTKIVIRPTFKEQNLILETHLFNFSKDIYQETITVYFIEKIRPEFCFPNGQELIKQIEKDKILVSEILNRDDYLSLMKKI
ncbi:bifunctional riboflavin kinase/FAD synthetase [bacterium]|nr:bifunctional riboflavin kinase/FAD synthetase [bacterium]